MRDSETERENEVYKLFELKNGIGAQGPKGEEGRCLLCHIDGFQIKFTFSINSFWARPPSNVNSSRWLMEEQRFP